MPVKSGLMRRINQSIAYQSETGNPIYRSSCTYGYRGTESSGAANFCGPISIDNHHPGFHHAPIKKFQKRQTALEKRQVVFQVGILVAMATGFRPKCSEYSFQVAIILTEI
ncbi:hypothetical protein NC652_001369 [Populus alba x Populus x berolinensis]|nr:hypothetical protein NC652_001369 [Populus alba x Populus x berolinensis]